MVRSFPSGPICPGWLVDEDAVVVVDMAGAVGDTAVVIEAVVEAMLRTNDATAKPEGDCWRVGVMMDIVR